MATETYVRAKIDPKTKALATVALESMGLTVSDAIRLLMVQVAEKNELPFKVKGANYINARHTKAAINQLERGKGKQFNSVVALMDDLNNDEED
ncbi:type II toxin-antitoxin system RelB/DinJ family antitoxin [Pectobacterium brasiliense]|uniref:type II toxin-antitoxin system RelB/DinJ family antitoxin n=1 Tax=Pectobacterium TaxID=122277 RepID=UPI00057F6D95|nr:MULTISPECIES: type II toxin-antitoxin system RelB/DinJ family antitoxin [Pectobacterium]KHT35166.1 translation repressor RelB [Pectobacterium carotovorum subsp. carotovorum]MDY4332905.1 type II toxin-antitoxin system RelB/DinJ family antitoxin [Pectobacterium brasiliense]